MGWYFMGRLCRVKKANGQIISVNQIYEKTPELVKNFGFWFRYDSRTGTHNAYKEFRALKLTDAVNQLYQDMAGRSRPSRRRFRFSRRPSLSRPSASGRS